MAMPNEAAVLARLNADAEYPGLFAKAFPNDKNPVNYENVGAAIAAFERTLISSSRFDDFINGDHKHLAQKNKLVLAVLFLRAAHLVIPAICWGETASEK